MAKIQTIELPAEAPVMALPNAPLLPFALLPLTIFEPRYRKMLAHALEHERMFCVALMQPGTAREEVHRVAGIGLIRACVGQETGTANLILQGLARVGITGWKQEEPFRIAKIEPLPSRAGETVEADALSAKVLELCSELKERGAQVPTPVDRQLAAIDDPSVLADIVSHTFIRSPFARQRLLEELSVPARLRLLISELREELVGRD